MSSNLLVSLSVMAFSSEKSGVDSDVIRSARFISWVQWSLYDPLTALLCVSSASDILNWFEGPVLETFDQTKRGLFTTKAKSIQNLISEVISDVYNNLMDRMSGYPPGPAIKYVLDH